MWWHVHCQYNGAWRSRSCNRFSFSVVWAWFHAPDGANDTTLCFFLSFGYRHCLINQASAIEALGMSLPYSSCTPATTSDIDGLYPDKIDECRAAGAALRNLMELDIKPRDIMASGTQSRFAFRKAFISSLYFSFLPNASKQRKTVICACLQTVEAFENAMTIVMALGGSTNATIHLIAMARSAGIDLTLEDMQRVRVNLGRHSCNFCASTARVLLCRALCLVDVM